jgi:hypothetical protein
MKLKSYETIGLGLVYNFHHIRKGVLLDDWTIHNLVPMEGLTDILNVYFKQGQQAPGWWLALYEGNYAPDGSITAADFPVTATECTAYTPATRVPWVTGVVTAGSLDNGASRAIFTMTAKKTVYGGALLSSSTKAGITGKLSSIVRFASPKGLEIDDQLSVAAGVTAISI